MDIKYTSNNLKKLEQILEEGGYLLRYEKGHFNSGYCVLEQRKIVVLKRFLDTEGKINVLLDLLPDLEIDVEELSPEVLPLYEASLSSKTL